MAKKESPPRPGLLAFLTSRFFLLNLLAAALVGLGLVGIAFGVLRGWTDHRHYVTVPDCDGLPLERAARMLEGKELEWTVMDSLYDPELPALTILGQVPRPSKEVKRGRVVHLTVNRVRPQMVEVPVGELLEKTLRSVQFKLRERGFRTGEEIHRPGVFDKQVVELREGGSGEALEPGARLPKGSVIDLVVTDGYGNTRVALPDVRGLTWPEAKFLLTSNNLVEGRTVFDPEIDSAEARVYRQAPAWNPDAYVKTGSMINLWLGEYPADSLSLRPNPTHPPGR